jgi:hypothetical protein
MMKLLSQLYCSPSLFKFSASVILLVFVTCTGTVSLFICAVFSLGWNSKSTKKVKVGASHHVSFMRPYGLFDVPLVVFSNWMTRFAFCDDIAHKCDFLGINYYGQVHV